jgi:hypothetical protein
MIMFYLFTPLQVVILCFSYMLMACWLPKMMSDTFLMRRSNLKCLIWVLSFCLTYWSFPFYQGIHPRPYCLFGHCWSSHHYNVYGFALVALCYWWYTSEDPSRYRHIVGSLVGLTIIGPNIAHAIHILSQFVSGLCSYLCSFWPFALYWWHHFSVCSILMIVCFNSCLLGLYLAKWSHRCLLHHRLLHSWFFFCHMEVQETSNCISF